MSMKPRIENMGALGASNLCTSTKPVAESTSMPDNLVNHTKWEGQPLKLKGTDKPGAGGQA